MRRIFFAFQSSFFGSFNSNCFEVNQKEDVKNIIQNSTISERISILVPFQKINPYKIFLSGLTNLRFGFKIIFLTTIFFTSLIGVKAQNAEDKKTSESSNTAESVATQTSDAPAQKLETIEVLAYRFSDNPLDIPVDAVSISAKKIEESGLKTIPDVLKRYSNVYFRSPTGNNNQAEISMRGFGENSSQRVLVIVDGQRINRPDIAFINWSNIPLETIENIEVLKGGQSAIYGNYAVGGVIKITTKKAKEGVHGNAGVSYGAYNELSAYAAASYGTKDFYARASADHYRDGGYRDNSTSWTNNASVTFGGFVNEKNELSFKANVSEEYVDYPGPMTYAEMNANPQKNSSVYYNPSETTNTYSMMSLDWQNESAIGSGGAEMGVNFNNRHPISNYGGFWTGTENFQYTVSFLPKYKITLGADEESAIEGGLDFYYDNVSVDVFNGLSPKIYASEALLQRATIGPWANAVLALDDTFSFNLGGRFETALNYGDNTNFTQPSQNFHDSNVQFGPSGQFGVNAKINETLSAYFRFDYLYRYPAIDEVAAYQGYPALIMYNNDLMPEKGQNFEVGLKHIGENLTASWSVFFNMMQDEIAYEIDPITWLGKNSNLDDTQRYGSEIYLGYALSHVGASTSWSFVRAEFSGGANKGNVVPLVPSIYSTTEVWLKPTDFTRFSVVYNFTNSQYQGGDYANTSKMAPSFSTVDFVFNLKFCDYASMYVSLNNAFDKKYASYAFYNSWYPAVGRTARVGIDIKF